MPKVTVDGVEIDVLQGATSLQACELERRISDNGGVLEAAE
ncbi:MAG TPA: hypothetical protein VGN68_00595 [Sphingopyxis sp.]|jgi:hypothetical protein|nr:hypothetical protein [Sphingopyxis sp.]